MRQIIIVRHGNTFEAGETPRRIGRSTDLSLTTEGVKQAEALGRHFAALSFDFVAALTSPLRRTVQTTQLILGFASRPIAAEKADWLAEIDHGPDEDKSEADIRTRIGERALLAWENLGIVPPDWHTDTENRLAAWRSFMAHAPQGAALLVTSNGAARFVFSACATLARSKSMKLRTGAYGHLVEQCGNWQLASWDNRP